MSWLLVAFIPALLMLATFGLQRLEEGLCGDTVSASDVADFLQQAGSDDVHTLARDGMDSALAGMQRRLRVRDGRAEPAIVTPYRVEPAGLPTKVLTHHGANPGFRPTRHANPV